MHLRRCSKNVAFCVCRIQQFTQDGIINYKQCPFAAQIIDNETKALLRVPFKSFTDELLGTKYVGGQRFSSVPFLRLVSRPGSSSHFSWSHWSICFSHVVMSYLSALFLMPLSRLRARGGTRDTLALWFSVLDDCNLYTCLSLKHVMSYTINYLSEGGYQSHPVTLAYVDRNSHQSHLGLTYWFDWKNIKDLFPKGFPLSNWK